MFARTCFLLIALLAVPPALSADDADLFATLDANKDGSLTKDEVPGDRAKPFERLLRTNDKDGDGKLSREEFTAAAAKPRGPAADEAPTRGFNPDEVFKRLDRDGDGKLTKEESPQRMRDNFERIDANSDGSIGLAEFREVAARFGAPAGRPETNSGGVAPLIRILDADGNGEVSAEEIKNAPQALLKLDRNGDGKLTRDELPGPPSGAGTDGRPGPEQLQRRLKEADRNDDGKLQKDEAPPFIAANFDRADRNGDGELDEQELKAVLERIGRRRPGGNQQREKR
jgi:Ca2+-binding EF-hand superfamily protein